jgi:hypothetical protein
MDARAVQRYNQMCQQQHGTHAEFDGTDSCQCKDGYEEGAGGQCVAAGGGPAAGRRGAAGSDQSALLARYNKAPTPLPFIAARSKHPPPSSCVAPVRCSTGAAGRRLWWWHACCRMLSRDLSAQHDAGARRCAWSSSAPTPSSTASPRARARCGFSRACGGACSLSGIHGVCGGRTASTRSEASASRWERTLAPLLVTPQLV